MLSMTEILLLVPMMFQPSDALLDGMAYQVVKQINKQQSHIAGIYHKSLLKQVSEDKLLSLYKGFFTQHGRVVDVTPQKRTTPESGKFTLVFEKGVEMELKLTINKQTPPKIIGLWFGPPVGSFKDIPSIIKEIEKLPGQVNFQVVRLGDEIKVIHAFHADRVLAIGSGSGLPPLRGRSPLGGIGAPSRQRRHNGNASSLRSVQLCNQDVANQPRSPAPIIPLQSKSQFGSNPGSPSPVSHAGAKRARSPLFTSPLSSLS